MVTLRRRRTGRNKQQARGRGVQHARIILHPVVVVAHKENKNNGTAHLLWSTAWHPRDPVRTLVFRVFAAKPPNDINYMGQNCPETAATNMKISNLIRKTRKHILRSIELYTPYSCSYHTLTRKKLDIATKTHAQSSLFKKKNKKKMHHKPLSQLLFDGRHRLQRVSTTRIIPLKTILRNRLRKKRPCPVQQLTSHPLRS